MDRVWLGRGNPYKFKEKIPMLYSCVQFDSTDRIDKRVLG